MSSSDLLKTTYTRLLDDNNIFQDSDITDMNVAWISTFTSANPSLELGITENGHWCIKSMNNFRELKCKQNLLYFINLLEIPINCITGKLCSSLNDVLNFECIDVFTLFPFVDIVCFVFDNVKSDYWLELALDWYVEFTPSMKEDLKVSLTGLVHKKVIPQKIRHRGMKELRNISNEYNLNNHSKDNE